MKKLFLILAFIAIGALPSFAELTVDDTVSDLYLKNHGYSRAMRNAVNRQIADVNGEAYEIPAEHELYKTPIAIYVRRFFTYLDPALDAETFYNHHNINTTTKWDDL